jgi:catechol 2,3-dioxygenase-like lactoylglutathione lyase family enzyme
MLHLVEWLDPKPVGSAYHSHAHVGWYRICPSVRHLDTAWDAVRTAGSTPFTAPFHGTLGIRGPDGPVNPYNVFCAHDPDGITLEWVEGSPDRFCLVGSNTSDAERFLTFYTDVLGLDWVEGVQTAGPTANLYDPDGGLDEFTGAFFRVRDDDRMPFDWLQWASTAENSTPYEVPNHVGVVRCAIWVDDIDAAFDSLSKARWEGRPVRLGGPPEVWSYGDFGEFRAVNLWDPEGVAFQLLEQPRHSPTLHPFTHDQPAWRRADQF